MSGERASPASAPRLLNVNVGLLGHVDSGKTSLARALSTTLSTAALDKSPQSVERGITLDLGFSSFTVPLPPRLAGAPFDALQVTLVDCPGHASLIRTIVGGAQIVDLMVLVLDATKGIQTQTAECLVIGELTTDKLVVALNKADLVPEEGRAATLAKLQKRLSATFAATRFAGCPQVVVAARPGGGEGPAVCAAQGLEALVAAIVERVELPAAEPQPLPPLLFAVDHCFAVRGQGTVATGTVLQGRVAVGQSVEVTALRRACKVKSLQAFHRPVTEARRGDRVGVCLTQLDATLLERGLLAEPGSLHSFSCCVAAVQRIRYFRGAVPSRTRMHVSIGHVTVMAELLFFAGPAQGEKDGAQPPAAAAAAAQLSCQLERLALQHRAAQLSLAGCEYEFLDQLQPAPGEEGGEATALGSQWALLTFDSPVVAPPNALLIGSRLDLDASVQGGAGSSACRLALHGRLAATFEAPQQPPQLRIFKRKQREGAVERWVDERTCVGRGLFKKETDISLFEGMRVTTGAGHAGVMQGAFGKSGKYKVYFAGGVPQEQRDNPAHAAQKLLLRFKRYLGDAHGRMSQ